MLKITGTQEEINEFKELISGLLFTYEEANENLDDNVNVTCGSNCTLCIVSGDCKNFNPNNVEFIVTK